MDYAVFLELNQATVIRGLSLEQAKDLVETLKVYGATDAKFIQTEILDMNLPF